VFQLFRFANRLEERDPFCFSPQERSDVGGSAGEAGKGAVSIRPQSVATELPPAALAAFRDDSAR
jgi:hypothetical protein